MLRGRTIVVGVSGGIAAYKSCELVRMLRARGAAVIVVMTPSAAEFVTPLTFKTLSGNPVVRELWGPQDPQLNVPDATRPKVRGVVAHVDVAEAADVLVIAPATADLMARLVHGEAPDALTCVALASRAPLVVCPAMDLEMWRHAATQANVRTLRQRGAWIVGPESGPLASGLEGPGRLAAIEAIVAAVERAAERRQSMEGVQVLVGAGRTEEPIDPVRVLTNRSTGRMGYAVAEAARDRGATVTLVTGAASVDPPEGVELLRVGTAAEMERAMLEAAATADVVVMAAAVSDYRPAAVAPHKLKKTDGDAQIALVRTPDILRGLGASKGARILVGFAAETEAVAENARRKLAEKRLDIIVANEVGDGRGFASEENAAVLIDAAGKEEAVPLGSKRALAERIWDRVAALRAARKAS